MNRHHNPTPPSAAATSGADDDRRLRQLFHEKLPQAPADPWAVRKVINRLPERRRPLYAPVEYACYAIAMLAIIAGWIVQFRSVTSLDIISVSNVAACAVLSILSIAVPISFAIPYVRRP